MRDYDIHLIGATTGAARAVLLADTKGRVTFRQLQEVLSTVSVYQGGTEIPPDPLTCTNTNEYFIARVLFGLLQRGLSPLSTPFVERSILKRVEDTLPFSEKWDDWEPGRKHVFQIDSDVASQEDFVQALFRKHARVPRNSNPEQGFLFDSAAERRFFDTCLSELLGPAIALVEPQRPIDTMLEVDSLDLGSFYQQRVDFAMETPSGLTKIVFEVDGPHHEESHQKDKDIRRDQALISAGWLVERVWVSDINQQWQPSPSVKQVLEMDKYLASFRECIDPVQSTTHDNEAELLVAVPHAIARTQLALCLAMMDGSLSFGVPVWKVVVWERDVAWTELAIVDFHEQLYQLCRIYGIEFETEVELTIVRDDCDSADYLGFRQLPSPRAVNRVFQPASPEAFQASRESDLFIDLSLDARPGDDFGTNPIDNSIEFSVPRVIAIRSAYRRAPEHFTPWSPPRPVRDHEGLKAELEFFVEYLFRKPSFRPYQFEIVERAMSRKNAIGLLPTGSGKSLTFQLPALLSPGISIIVAPLRSLMDDQVDNLHRAGITRVQRIHGGLERKTSTVAFEMLQAGEARLIYIAPERFQSVRFRKSIQASPIARDISFIVIDEAHCVSEWGHDFRPAYLNLGRVAREVCKSGEEVPPLLALTATASMLVLADIQRELDIGDQDENAVVATDSFLREELKYLPIRTSNSDKREKLMQSLAEISVEFDIEAHALLTEPSYGGIVFCRHVNGPYGIEEVAQAIRERHSLDLDSLKIFSGARPRKSAYVSGADDWERYKSIVQRSFKSDGFPLLVATHGFGMGIDKQNIRYTVHYGIPGSIEALAQESGRAGRDRKTSICAVVFTDQESLPENDCLDQSISAEVANHRAKLVDRREQGDLSRLMYFHAGSFKGSDHDKTQSIELLNRILECWEDAKVEPGEPFEIQIPRLPIGSTEGESNDIEKSIYRLSLLGIVTDYTTDWQTRFDVQTVHLAPWVVEENLKGYFRRYRARERGDAVIEQAKSRADPSRPYDHLIGALCSWIYEEIEKGRRRSMANLIDALRRSKEDGSALAQEINQHLSDNTFTGRIASLAQRIDPEEWWAIVRDVQSLAMANQMLGSCRRTLESIPDHPGLIFLDAIGSLWRPMPDVSVIATNLRLGLQNYAQRYGASNDDVRSVSVTLLTELRSQFPEYFERIVAALLALGYSESVAMAAYPLVTDPNLKRLCAVPWITRIAEVAHSTRSDHIGAIA